MILTLGIGLLIMVGTLLFIRTMVFQDVDPGLEQLSITESEIHHSTSESRRFISIVGKIRNSGDKPLKNPHFEIQFFNADGKLIDSLASGSFDLIIPARAEVSFKVRGYADRPAHEYARYQIRLTGVGRARIF